LPVERYVNKDEFSEFLNRLDSKLSNLELNKIKNEEIVNILKLLIASFRYGIDKQDTTHIINTYYTFKLFERNKYVNKRKIDIIRSKMEYRLDSLYDSELPDELYNYYDGSIIELVHNFENIVNKYKTKLI